MKDLIASVDGGAPLPCEEWPTFLVRWMSERSNAEIDEMRSDETRTPEQVRERCRIELTARRLEGRT